MSNVKQLVHNLIDLGTKSPVVLMPYVWTKQDVEEWFETEFTPEEWATIVDKVEMNVDDVTESLFEVVRGEVEAIRPPKQEEETLDYPYFAEAMKTILRLRDDNPDIPAERFGELLLVVYRAIHEAEVK
jgi:hypothetical protein